MEYSLSYMHNWKTLIQRVRLFIDLDAHARRDKIDLRSLSHVESLEALHVSHV